MTRDNKANMQNFRRRAKEQELVRVELYLHPLDAEAVRKLAQMLKEARRES